MFETRGERRLATHLLQGLGLLLDEAVAGLGSEELAHFIAKMCDCFPDNRKAENGALVENPLQKPKQKLVSSTQSVLKFIDP